MSALEPKIKKHLTVSVYQIRVNTEKNAVKNPPFLQFGRCEPEAQYLLRSGGYAVIFNSIGIAVTFCHGQQKNKVGSRLSGSYS